MYVRRNRLRKELPGSTVSTVAGRINAAARLRATKIGIVIGQADGLIEAQEPRIRVDDLHVIGVSGRYPLSRLVHAEAGQGRIQGHDGRQSASAHPLAGQTGRVSTQTVAQHSRRAEIHAVHGIDKVHHLSDARSHFVDPVSGRDVIDRLGTRSPVHYDHIKFATGVISVSDPNVDRRAAVVVPAMNDKPANGSPIITHNCNYI